MLKASKIKSLFLVFSLFFSGIVIGNVVTSFAAKNGSIISACVNRKTGSMRYLSKGRCQRTELSVSWNVQGPTGAGGVVGPQGLQGPRGQTGDLGPVGSVGPQGPTGPAGSDGSSLSNTVLSGAGAPANSSGINGDLYIDTSTNKIYGPKANGIWSAGVSLVGPAGTTGATGLAGVAGPQGPSGQGVFSYVPSVAVSKSNIDADAIALSSYTTVTSVGSDVEVAIACGYETVSTPSIVAWSIAVKAPSGSKVLGQTSYRNDSAPDYLYGVADGTRRRLIQDTRNLELTNGEFLTLSIFGSSVSPVVLQLSVDLTSSSCSASGILQTL